MAFLALLPVSVAVFTTLNVSALQALVSTRIWDGVPQAPVFPFVFYEVREREERGMGSGYGLPEVELMVHAVSSYEGLQQAQAIMQQCIELLRDQTLTVSAYAPCGRVFYDETLLLPEADLNGVPVRELVARFRLYLQEA